MTDATQKPANPSSRKNSGNSGNDLSQGVTGVENVDKIRDILFGSKMRDYERKFTRLEERIMKEVTRLREESSRRFDDLEGYLNKEVESLSTRLKNEQNNRTEAEKDLADDLIKTAKLLEKKLAEMGDQFDSTTRELRQQLLDQSKTLSLEIGRKYDETSVALERSAEELRDEKVDRSALSGLLTELALRLSDDPMQNLGLDGESFELE